MKYICVAGEGETVYLGESPMDAFAELVDGCGNAYKAEDCKFYEIGREVVTIVQPKPVAKPSKKGK